MSRDFAEDEIIFAYQQIGLGRDAAEVFVEITGNDEYSELGAVILLGHVRAWYKKQSPRRLRELAGMPVMELGA